MTGDLRTDAERIWRAAGQTGCFYRTGNDQAVYWNPQTMEGKTPITVTSENLQKLLEEAGISLFQELP